MQEQCSKRSAMCLNKYIIRLIPILNRSKEGNTLPLHQLSYPGVGLKTIDAATGQALNKRTAGAVRAQTLLPYNPSDGTKLMSYTDSPDENIITKQTLKVPHFKREQGRQYPESASLPAG